MPKNECDPEDPMELCGVGLLTEEDTSETMAECFIEEFLRLGYSAGQIFALFSNRYYTGMNLVMQNRGEAFVKEKIVEVFGWWQRPADGLAGPVRPDDSFGRAGHANAALSADGDVTGTRGRATTAPGEQPCRDRGISTQPRLETVTAVHASTLQSPCP